VSTKIPATLCALALTALSSSAFAFEAKHTSGGLPVHWASSNVTFEVDPSVEAAMPGSTVALQEAFSGWSGQSGAPVLATTAGSGGAQPGNDGRNIIFYAPNGYAPAGSALAVTVLSYDDNTGAIVDADIVINGTHAFEVLAADAVAPPGTQPVSTEGGDSVKGHAHELKFDLIHVVAHETGHALGLSDDTAAPGALMYVYTLPNDASMRGPSADDLAGISALYGATSGGSGSGSTDSSGTTAKAGCSVGGGVPLHTGGCLWLGGLALGAAMVLRRRQNKAPALVAVRLTA